MVTNKGDIIKYWLIERTRTAKIKPSKLAKIELNATPTSKGKSLREIPNTLMKISKLAAIERIPSAVTFDQIYSDVRTGVTNRESYTPWSFSSKMIPPIKNEPRKEQSEKRRKMAVCSLVSGGIDNSNNI
jgi:hypothetical protein